MKKLRMTVNFKVILGIVAIMFCVGLVGLSVFDATENKSMADAQSIHTYQMISYMKEMRLDLAKVVDYEHDFSMTSDNSVRPSYVIAADKMNSDLESLSDWVGDGEGRMDELRLMLKSIPSELNAMKLIENEDGEEELIYERGDGFDQIERADELIETMISLGEEELVENKAEAGKKHDELIWWIVFGTILCSFMALVTAMIMVYMVTKPLVRLTGVIDDISKGDLATSIDEKILKKNDEIGDLARAFDRTMVSLKLAMKKNNKK